MKQISIYFIVTGLMLFQYMIIHAQQRVEPVLARTFAANTSRVNITPNPVHGNSNFYVQVDSCNGNTTGRLVVFDNSGYVMQNNELRFQPGSNSFLVNVSGYNPGYYTVRLIGNDIPSLSYSKRILIDQ